MFGPFFIKGGQKQIFSNTWAPPDFADYISLQPHVKKSEKSNIVISIKAANRQTDRQTENTRFMQWAKRRQKLFLKFWISKVPTA